MSFSFEKWADIRLSSARTRTWTVNTFGSRDTACKHVGRAQTNEIMWQVVYRHVLLWKKNCMRTRPCKSNSCVEGRLFTVNPHHSPSRRSNQCSQTWFRTWKVAYWEGFVSYVVWLYIVSIMTNMLTYVKSYAQTCLRKSKSTHNRLFVREHAHEHVS